MLKPLLLLFFIAIAPLSASAYEYFETHPYDMISKDPTVCYISFDYVEQYENVTKQAISDWESGLKQYTNNNEAWNIHYKFIQNDHEDDVRAEIDSLDCDIFVDFTDNVENSDGDIVDVYGSMGKVVSGHTVLQISTSNGLSFEQLVSTTTHELGHAFGLGHYITDEIELVEKWDQGIDLPSIMIEDAITVGIEKITELDLKKMITLYGIDGFEKNKSTVPDWVKNTAGWWADGMIGQDEYLDSIKYLMEIGIIQVN